MSAGRVKNYAVFFRKDSINRQANIIALRVLYLIKFHGIADIYIKLISDDRFDSASVFFCLSANQGKSGKNEFKKPATSGVTSRRFIRHPAVNQCQFDFFPCRKSYKVRPYFYFKNNQQLRFYYFESAPDADKKINRAINRYYVFG